MAAAENSSSVRERCAMLLIKITDLVRAASNMPVHKQQFTELAGLVDRMKPILRELQNQNVHNSTECLKVALRDLQASMDEALKLLQANKSSSSKWLLLLRCPDIFKKIQVITHRIASSLDHVPLASLAVSLSTKEKVAELCEAMKKAEFKAAVETEEVIAKLKGAFREVDTNSEKNLRVLLEIAKLTGACVDSSFVMREKEAIKKEIAELEEEKCHAEAHILGQVMAFLSRVDIGASSSRNDTSLPVLRRTGSIPIKSFCCPMTGNLMEDPVDIASGCTFERREIEAWFAQGNNICPVTKEPLESFELHANRSLSELIKEWQERNAKQRLGKAALDLFSQDSRTAKEALSELLELLSSCRHVDAELLVRRLVELPRVLDENFVRVEALQCLSILADRNSENKVLIAKESGVDLAVECLGYENTEIRTKGTMVLLDLSKDSQLCGDIGKARDCIPRLVALANIQDTHLSKAAEQVLENLASVSDNLTSMTHANHLKPLLRRITQGSEDDKVCMAMLLGSTELTDYSISTLVRQGILPLLVQMLSEKTPDPNLSALKALHILSRQPDAKEALLSTTDVVKSLLELLRNRQAPASRCGEIAAKLLADLVLHSCSAETHAHDEDLAVLTEKENIQALLALLATADMPYPIKGHLLQILLGVVSTKTESGTRKVMRDAGAIRLLLSFCDDQNPTVRRATFNLLNSITEDGTCLDVVESLEETHIKNFVVALSHSSSDVEEKTAVAGILSNICTQDHHQILNMLLSTDALRTVLRLLSTISLASENNRLIENALGIFLLFTSNRLPSDFALRMMTEFETTSVLVRILNGGKTGLAKQRAATGLAQLSHNTMLLNRPAAQARWRNFFGCCKQVTTDACVVHRRICQAKDCFCLVEANAIVPLVKTLGDMECCADEAALAALDTLLDSETLLRGIRAIEKAEGLIPLKLLLTKGSPKAKERVLPVIQKITTFESFHYLIQQEETHALVRLMQECGDPVRQIAARILGNTGKIEGQSNYFE